MRFMRTQTSSVFPRKILMTVDSIGGVWTYALELARALEPYGIEIAFASMGGRLSREQHEQVVGRKNVRLFESAYGSNGWMILGRMLIVPEIGCCNSPRGSALISFISTVTATPFSPGMRLYWLRATHVCCPGGARSKVIPRRRNTTSIGPVWPPGLRAADLVVAPSPAMRDASWFITSRTRNASSFAMAAILVRFGPPKSCL